MKKRYIWQNTDLNVDDWRDAFRGFCELNDIEPDDDGDAVAAFMYETNNEYFFDELLNLNKIIDSEIIVIGDFGRWSGRAYGYKIIGSQNLKDILNHDEPFFEIYGDGKNIRATGCHHDGINYYLYRAARPGRDIDKLLNSLYCGEYISPQKLNYYTRSIYPDVARVYGW